MEKTKQTMKNVTAGRSVSQESDVKATQQGMENLRAHDDVNQDIRTQMDENSLSLRGFGSARGKRAVVVIGILFALFLVWKFFIAK